MMPSQAVNVTGRSLDPVTKRLTIKAEPFLRSALFATNDCKGYISAVKVLHVRRFPG